MTLSSPLTEVKGIGPAIAGKFAAAGITSIADLLDYYPRTYDDYSKIIPINQLKPGAVTIQARIVQAKGRYIRRGMHITEAVVSDETGSVKLVWFNQPYRQAALKHDHDYFISGEFGLKAGKLTITNPSAELATDFPINTARIIPIYRESAGLKSTQIRKAIAAVSSFVGLLEETLPSWMVQKYKLLSFSEAISGIHFPKSPEHLLKSRLRLGYEEVFSLTLAALLNKYDLLHEKAIAVPFDEALAKEFVSHLTFQLTDDQRRAIWQIYIDMQKTQPMNRLIEGDVGSGKTVVAVMAGMMAIAQGFQVAIMAPTELLARQHAETLFELLEPLGFGDKVGLLVGGLSAAQKREMQQKIKDGTVGFIVGTHALIQAKVDMHNLGLVIVDEQHRFGVEQRKALQAKAGHALHVLNMTATPIPRSLALTLYGELDLTIIAHKPMGRKPINTEIISPNSKDALYKKVIGELEAGRQAFVVCPLVSESDKLEASSAEKTFETLQKGVFKEYRLGLLHGKMKPIEKDAVMRRYAQHEIDVLVATTVIEVGVNVPNATVMIVENADRFGLAQIHQLRGRVGRSNHQGYCYLVMSDSKPPSKRMRALATSSDGFALAELDLEIRGPGAIYGSFQHGQLDLRIAKLSDVKLIAAARKGAQRFIDSKDDLLQYKTLHDRVQKLRAVTNLN